MSLLRDWELGGGSKQCEKKANKCIKQLHGSKTACIVSLSSSMLIATIVYTIAF